MVEGGVEAAGVVALPAERWAVAPVLGLLQEEEGEEEQLCGAGGAGHGGHHREGPTAGGEEDHSWRGVGRDCHMLDQERLRKGKRFAWCSQD